ncbi:unnamed protein product [Adineta ricciae]|uniref:Uncharacterized protein n=1 Tax=Adineta ricciae TaxID=249248 RepID=A0A814UM28_ADIRI|nr:unnamed protein product [Adineta ricciae]
MLCHNLPGANRHLAEKSYLKAQADHKRNIKNARSMLDQSPPASHPHCSQRIRQKQIKEQELARIKHENERLLTKIVKNGAFVDCHNHYVPLNLNKQHRKHQQLQYESDFQRLQQRVNQVQATYSAREYAKDYAKTQTIQKRLCRYPPTKK